MYYFLALPSESFSFFPFQNHIISIIFSFFSFYYIPFILSFCIFYRVVYNGGRSGAPGSVYCKHFANKVSKMRPRRGAINAAGGQSAPELSPCILLALSFIASSVSSSSPHGDLGHSWDPNLRNSRPSHHNKFVSISRYLPQEGRSAGFMGPGQ